ncbi:hypothetical protein BS78_01G305100 [Paspalum vaginatum]|nr:hypothetical protein BS78_01G305100 [Paspalum vaginatum]KAJ1296493.1 hypothetical protein BS78_01G305100 [Paspalum vaginatum]KAJ1296494.1 hypothetical protein BS78_01G305100 [Paspalum vaginatum]KAJ1296495.1 hypothetical protein BS78_01G305100 [Paspalum vaginatum]
MELCVPPGFRFHPTDEELVGYYLRKKVASQKIDLDVIRDVDLYRIEPWDLQEHCKIGYEEQSDWYFFSYKDRKYPTGTRTNRATLTGFWKATGRDKAVRDGKQGGGGLIGMRKTLVFYTGRAPNGRKTDWIMHEYRLETDENAAPQEEGWVVCRAFKKRTMHPPRSVAGAWDPSYSYCHDPPILAGAAHFKQELPELDSAAAVAATASALLQYSSRIAAELPQLESPPLQNQQGRQSHGACLADGEGDHAATTDWRALDRFVASQLTPGGEEHTTGQGLQQQEYCGKPPLVTTTHAGDDEDYVDMAGLLLLDGVLHGEAGLLRSVADPACLHQNAARFEMQRREP